MVEVLMTAERLQDYIRVLFLGGSEEYEFIVVAQGCQQLHEVRPKFNINLWNIINKKNIIVSGTYKVLSIRCAVVYWTRVDDSDTAVISVLKFVSLCAHQGLVQVENYRLLVRGPFLILDLELLRPQKILILYFIKLYVFLLLYLNLECIFEFPEIFFAVRVIFEKCAMVISLLLDTLDVFIGDLIPLYALLEAWEVDVGLGLLVEVLVSHLDL